MTVQLKLAEPILDAIVAKLQDGLPDRIAQINAEKDDGIQLKTPSSDDYYLGGVAELPRAPAVLVTELASPPYAEEGAHSFIFSAEVAVAVIDQDPDRSVLARRLLRLARAVTETVWDDAPAEALSGSAYRIVPFRHSPGRVFEIQDTTTEWRSLYLIAFRAYQLEGS